MNAPCVDIKAYLDTISSIGATIYSSFMPDTPTSCVSIIDGPGLPSETNYSYERPTIQIRVRAEEYENAYSILKEIKNELHGLTNTTINSTKYVQILAEGDIMSLGYDTNNFASLVLNFSIHRTT